MTITLMKVLLALELLTNRFPLFISSIFSLNCESIAQFVTTPHSCSYFSSPVTETHLWAYEHFYWTLPICRKVNQVQIHHFWHETGLVKEVICRTTWHLFFWTRKNRCLVLIQGKLLFCVLKRITLTVWYIL